MIAVCLGALTARYTMREETHKQYPSIQLSMHPYDYLDYEF